MSKKHEEPINIEFTLDEFADAVEAQHDQFMEFAPMINEIVKTMGGFMGEEFGEDDVLFTEEWLAEKDKKQRDAIAALRESAAKGEEL